MIFFTADTHFNHKNIIKYCKRPFGDVIEMNEVMIEKWNKMVKPTDTIYHLGDFGFGEYEYILRELHGKKYMVIGSHDKQVWKYKKYFEGMDNIMVVDNIILCHYAMRVWSKSHYNSFHLYGHSHGMLEGAGKSFDIGVDCWDFAPVNIEIVKECMKCRPDNFNLVLNKR